MSSQATLWDTRKFTSSQAEASGVSPLDAQDGQTADPCGVAAPLAPASRRRAKAEGLATLVTSGLMGHDSSASAALQSSLESRLMTQLDTAGSTLFKLTWKRKRTPLGRRYLERAVSVRRTSVSASTLLASWPTPNAVSMNDTDSRWEERREEQKRRVMNGNGFGLNLSMAVSLAAWATPKVRDFRSASRPQEQMAKQLSHPRGQDLNVEATLTQMMCSMDSGEMPSGFPAEFLKYPEQLSGGLLNGAHSFWLQGIPNDWRSFVSLAMQSTLKLRRRSFAPTTGAKP